MQQANDATFRTQILLTSQTFLIISVCGSHFFTEFLHSGKNCSDQRPVRVQCELQDKTLTGNATTLNCKLKNSIILTTQKTLKTGTEVNF